jgi:hypothetical protein
VDKRRIRKVHLIDRISMFNCSYSPLFQLEKELLEAEAGDLQASTEQVLEGDSIHDTSKVRHSCVLSLSCA